MMSQNLESTKSKYAPSEEELSNKFAHVFDEYKRPIFNYLLRMTQNRELADDLTQETFLRVHKGLQNFRGDSSLSTWIYRIASNVSFDYFRSKGSYQEQLTDSIDEAETSRVTVPDKGTLPPEQATAQHEMSACVQRFIRELPLDYRAVIVLSDLQGLKNRDIADVLDISLDTVKIRLHRARKQLRAALNLGCDFSHDERNVMVCEEKPAEQEKAE